MRASKSAWPVPPTTLALGRLEPSRCNPATLGASPSSSGRRVERRVVHDRRPGAARAARAASPAVIDVSDVTDLLVEPLLAASGGNSAFCLVSNRRSVRLLLRRGVSPSASPFPATAGIRCKPGFTPAQATGRAGTVNRHPPPNDRHRWRPTLTSGRRPQPVFHGGGHRSRGRRPSSRRWSVAPGVGRHPVRPGAAYRRVTASGGRQQRRPVAPFVAPGVAAID